MLEKYFDSSQKTAMLICKIALPDSPHPIIIIKNPRFQALHLAVWNEFHFLHLILFYFGCCLLPEKFSIVTKNNGFAQLRAP